MIFGYHHFRKHPYLDLPYVSKASKCDTSQLPQKTDFKSMSLSVSHESLPEVSMVSVPLPRESTCKSRCWKFVFHSIEEGVWLFAARDPHDDGTK